MCTNNMVLIKNPWDVVLKLEIYNVWNSQKCLIWLNIIKNIVNSSIFDVNKARFAHEYVVAEWWDYFV